MSETELTEAVLTAIRENPEAVIKALGPTVSKMLEGKSLVELLTRDSWLQEPEFCHE